MTVGPFAQRVAHISLTVEGVTRAEFEAAFPRASMVLHVDHLHGDKIQREISIQSWFGMTGPNDAPCYAIEYNEPVNAGDVVWCSLLTGESDEVITRKDLNLTAGMHIDCACEIEVPEAVS